MEKTIEVTIKIAPGCVDKMEFYDPESGDFCRLELPTHMDWEQNVKNIGLELYSWLPLMYDEMSEQEEDSHDD